MCWKLALQLTSNKWSVNWVLIRSFQLLENVQESAVNVLFKPAFGLCVVVCVTLITMMTAGIIAIKSLVYNNN